MNTIILQTLFLFVSVNLASSQWILQTSQFDKPVTQIYFINEYTGWLSFAGYNMFASTGGFAYTTNGGSNWTENNNVTYNHEDFCFINAATGWTAGFIWFDTPPNGYGYIQKTTDGGLNFTYQVIDTGRSFHSIYFINSNTGWASGKYSTLYKTTNGGVNWITIIDSTGTFSNFTKLHFIDNDTGFAINRNTVLKTVNSGYNWSIKYTAGGSNLLFGLKYIGNNYIYCGGSNGLIIRSTDLGENWQLQSSQTTRTIRDFSFLNSNIGYAAGGNDQPFNKVVLKTTNSGANWSVSMQTNGNALYSIHFVNRDTGWAAGGESIVPYGIGSVYSTTNGGAIGIVQISTSGPASFSLSQNYPNPFNPVTNIKFDVPRSSFVKLAIFDMLGREIAVMVNQNMNAGTYYVDWDASAYPSGVYFYKIVSGDFIETKKMMLVK